MPETPEPLSAILAEMRAARNAVSDMTLIPTEWLSQWADRIEAAAERERAALDVARKVAKDTAEQYRKLYEKKKEADNPARGTRRTIPHRSGTIKRRRDARGAGEDCWTCAGISHIRSGLERARRRSVPHGIIRTLRSGEELRHLPNGGGCFSACHADRGYISNPVDERRSTISFMLSNAQKSPKVEPCDVAPAEGGVE